MEERFDRATKAVADLVDAMERYEKVQDDLAALEQYMDSGQWQLDFEVDEAGWLPADLKRGVLSEDGLWNLLTDNRELQKRLNII